MDPLLAIENLRTYFYSRAKRAFIRSVDGASLAVARGETLGVVGESGSGKTVTALSAAGLVSAAPGVIGGRIELSSNGVKRNLLEGLERYVRVEERDGRVTAVKKDERGWRRRAERSMAGVRGKEIAMIFQNPRAALNPYSTIGTQLVETIRLHTGAKAEREAKERNLSPPERQWLRQERAPPLLDALKARLEGHLPKVPPKGPLAEAIGYSLNHWKALTRYLEDGRLEIDNNAVERAIRPVAQGRANWLFVASERGGHAAAALYSLIESAKATHHP